MPELSPPHEPRPGPSAEPRDRRRARSASDRALQGRAVATAGMVAACATFAMYAAFSPRFATSVAPFAIAGAVYLALGAFTAHWLRGRGELGDLLRPMRLDITRGFAVAGAMWAVSKLGAVVIAPEGSASAGWLMKLYHQTSWAAGRPAAGILVMWVSAAEELVWRGLVFGALRAGFGARVALWGSAGLYALCHLPTAFTLAAERAGPNPFVILAAGLGGVVWGVMAWRTHRLAPGIFAHALFSWAIVEFPLHQL